MDLEHSRHLFSRLDAVQSLLGPMQLGWQLILRTISKTDATRCLNLKATVRQILFPPRTPLGELTGYSAPQTP